MTIYHKHHIVPKHMGGTDDPSNLIELSIEEHAEAHRKLFEQYGHWQDELAWKGLLGIIPNAEMIKHVQSAAGKLQKGKKRGPQCAEHIQKRIRKGWSHTQESKDKMRLASLGNKHNCGRKQSKETVEKRLATIASRKQKIDNYAL
jgi:hypothetical protein